MSNADNLSRYLVTAISTSRETIQFYCYAPDGWSAMAEAATHEDCGDVIKLERIVDKPHPIIPRPSWIAGADGHPTGILI